MAYRSRRSSLAQSLEGLNKDFANELDGGRAAEANSVWFFEVAWEVANQIGGIYTVIKSKAAVTVAELGEHYCLIGPLRETKAWMEVEIMEPHENEAMMKAIQHMRDAGFRVVYGHWLIEGYPKVVLFDLGSATYKCDEWKQELWDSANIGIPFSDHEATEALVFGFLTAMFLEEFMRSLSVSSHIVTHFHEWIAGVGLLVSRFRHLNIATIFTTHATMLGRHLCAGHVDFYNNIDKLQLDKEAGDRSIYQRYCLERAIVHVAHVFTTVSDITSFEAEHILGRKPELVLPNGLNVKYGLLHEFHNKHSKSKEKINEFIRGHFYGHFDFNLDKTLYFFNSGRYEFSNKGVDLYIEALARLNHYLQSNGSGVTVVAFLIFPARTNSFNYESLRGQAVAKQLKETVASIQKDVGVRMFDSCLRGELPDPDSLMSKEDIIKLKRCIVAAQRQTLPPICTHNIVEDGIDLVLCTIRKCRLFNDRSDRVKVIFHPEFLNSTNPLFGMDYDEFIRGCNLGVFPSYYEPWGYTPAECTVMGIPSITTNLSGFGCFMEQTVSDPMSYGIYIVDRRYKSPEESIQQLTQYMLEFATQTRRQRIIQRNRTERLSELLDWKNLGVYYSKARHLALHRTYPDTFPKDASVLTGHEKMKELPSPRLLVTATPAVSDADCDTDSYDERDELNNPKDILEERR